MERSQDGVAEHRCGNVADAQNRVAPAAVGVLMLGQPVQTTVDHPLPGISSRGPFGDVSIRRFHGLQQRHHGRGGRQRRR